MAPLIPISVKVLSPVAMQMAQYLNARKMANFEFPTNAPLDHVIPTLVSKISGHEGVEMNEDTLFMVYRSLTVFFQGITNGEAMDPNIDPMSVPRIMGDANDVASKAGWPDETA